MKTLRCDPPALVFRHQAMATWFEVHIVDEEPGFAKGVAAEAFLLLDRLESLLSRYRESSEISIISRLQPGERFLATQEVFDCLALALSFSEASSGAFDPALGHEMDIQRGLTDFAQSPERGRLLLDAATLSICCEGSPVSLDLGGIGKGFALDRMAEMMKEWGVSHALLVGGGSSFRTLADSGDEEAPHWSVGLGNKSRLWLQSGGLGCSGIAVQGTHIIDPRSGKPACGAERIWVLAPTAAEADAFSTAFMVLSTEELDGLCGESCSLAVARQKKAEDAVEWIWPAKAGFHGGWMAKDLVFCRQITDSQRLKWSETK